MANETRQGLEKIIGQLWFVKDNFESISKHPLVVRRLGLIQDIIKLFVDYDRKKVPFAEGLVLDNFTGSLQRYLMGLDLESIHLSSKTLEIALLIKIGEPTEGERCSSFRQLCNLAISEPRRLINQKENVKRVGDIVERRNFTTHDAIAEQVVLWVSKDWIHKKLAELTPFQRAFAVVVLQPLLHVLNQRLKPFDSIPDLRWYVYDKSFESSKNLIAHFLDVTIGRDLNPIRAQKGDSNKVILEKLSNARHLPKSLRSTAAYESDFIEYSARTNLIDVRKVLNELYDNKLFNF